MSNIYMVKKDITFYDNQPAPGYTNKLMQQDSITFPSNVINCSLTIAQNTYNVFDPFFAYDDTAAGTVPLYGQVSYIGSGIDNVSFLGTDVIFTAWMQLLNLQDNGTKAHGSLYQYTSYLTVLAIAYCE